MDKIVNVEQYTLYFASGLPVVYDSDVARPVNSRLHTGKEARMYDPLLMRFFIQFVKYYIK